MMTIQQALETIHQQIQTSTQLAHRPESSVTLLAVSKTKPNEAILEAYHSGQKAFGENYVQEGVDKIQYFEAQNIQLEWHFIGPLQSNKTRLVAEHFDWMQTLERAKIADRLHEQRPANKAPLNILIQINISDEESKSGIQPSEMIKLAKHIEVNEVEDITGQKINHVALIQFGGLVKVVDALGGVELCYDQDVDDPYSSLNWTAGCHTADGNTALAFSRMRYADAQGDFGRAARQRQVINAIVKKAASRQTLMNFAKAKTVAQAALSSVTVDEKASTASLLRMALAFKSASGDKGISGSVYWTDPDYYVDGVGSSVLLDEQKNLDLFSQLATGKHASGTVGTLAEQS